MTISKTLAEQIAIKLCEKKQKAYLQAEKVTQETIEHVYIKKIPKDIMAFFKKHPKMTKTCSYVTIQTSNYNYMSSNFSKSLPEIYNIMDNIFTQSEKDSFFKMHNQANDLKKEFKQLKEQVENALLNLKTTKRIAEHFPEAVPYLPTSEKFELAINLTDIRKQIK